MTRITHRGLAAFAIVIGGVAGAFVAAPPASAIVFAQYDEVTIRRDGFDVGGLGFADGSPTTAAELYWVQDWNGTAPILGGYIHFDGVNGSCARVRLLSYDDAGDLVGSANLSNEECAYSNGHSAKHFEVSGEIGATEVVVTLQTLASNGTWGGIGGQTLTYGPIIDTDDVLISRAEFDLGAGELVGGAPERPATVTWTLTNNDYITPIFDGSLFIREADDLCARVRIRYSSEALGVIGTRYTNEICQTSDDDRIVPLHLDQFESRAVDEVKYTIESRSPGGTWSAVGSTTVYLN
jgi:hypothetical protein